MANERESQTRIAPDDTALAWSLTEIARPYMSAAVANSVHIAIGVGDQFGAIDTLLSLIARAHLLVDADLVATVGTWLDCYVGQDDEYRLRGLLADITSRENQAPEEGPSPPPRWTSSG